MDDILLLLAQGPPPGGNGTITLDLTWFVGICVSAVGVVSGGVKLLWSYWTKRLDDETVRYQAMITAKDTAITELQKELSRKSDEHAHSIERLQGLTITKMETFNDKVVGLVERVVEQQAETGVILRSLQVDRRGGSDSGPTGR